MLSARSLIREYIKRNFAVRVDLGQNADEHVPILLAIRHGQPEAARQAMFDHLASGMHWLLALAKEGRLEQNQAPKTGADQPIPPARTTSG